MMQQSVARRKAFLEVLREVYRREKILEWLSIALVIQHVNVDILDYGYQELEE